MECHQVEAGMHLALLKDGKNMRILLAVDHSEYSSEAIKEGAIGPTCYRSSLGPIEYLNCDAKDSLRD